MFFLPLLLLLLFLLLSHRLILNSVVFSTSSLLQLLVTSSSIQLLALPHNLFLFSSHCLRERFSLLLLPSSPSQYLLQGLSTNILLEHLYPRLWIFVCSSQLTEAKNFLKPVKTLNCSLILKSLNLGNKTIMSIVLV